MSKDMTRAEAIEVLKNMIKCHEEMLNIDRRLMNLLGSDFIEEKITALKYALRSLETDEKYGLLYMEAADDKETEKD